MNNKPKDLLGNEISIGDKVLFMQIKYREFMEGIIKSMAEKSALISHGKTNLGKTESRQYYGQIISLSALDRVEEHLQSENTRLRIVVEDVKGKHMQDYIRLHTEIDHLKAERDKAVKIISYCDNCVYFGERTPDGMGVCKKDRTCWKEVSPDDYRVECFKWRESEETK